MADSGSEKDDHNSDGDEDDEEPQKLEKDGDDEEADDAMCAHCNQAFGTQDQDRFLQFVLQIGCT